MDFLKRQGVTILERNFRSRQGEVDVICKDGEYLVFVEVKYRGSFEKGSPEEAVGIMKQKRICKVSDYYRLIHGLDDATSIRYDVIAIAGEDVKWLQNAFPYRGF